MFAFRSKADPAITRSCLLLTHSGQSQISARDGLWRVRLDDANRSLAAQKLNDASASAGRPASSRKREGPRGIVDTNIAWGDERARKRADSEGEPRIRVSAR